MMRTHLKIRFHGRDTGFLRRGEAADAEPYRGYGEAEPQAAAKNPVSEPKWNFEMGSTTRSFLQSAEWEQFQHTLGRKTWRAAGVLVIRHDLPLGLNYLYAPHPDPSRFTSHIIQDTMLREIEKIGARERSIFLKIDPLAPLLYRDTCLVCREAPSLQPRETIIIDLVQPEEKLLAAMHEKTRYNIRLAERKNVECRIANVGFGETNDFEIFWRLLQETAARDGFRTHLKEYYKKLLETRSDRFSNELFFAEYHGTTVAVALINFYGSPTSIGMATYLHGASSGADRQVMAPHLLHWRIIREAKRRGCAAYDLWGIDEARWPGLTRFKQGFSGSILIRPASVDAVYRSSPYFLYSLWRRFSRK